MIAGSLFSGIGGFDIGFARAGIDTAWQVEIDPLCRKVLQKHFKSEVFTDVKEVGKRNLSTVDIIFGGFPCQDLSVAGKREGLAGERSGLWFEFHRIIGELKPQWVVIENVPGLLSSNRGRDFAVVLRGLVECGYGASWRILDAQYFGVPQRRRRVFIVGSLGSGRSAEVLFERECLPRNTEKGGEKGTEVAYSIMANPSHSCDKGDGGINQTLIAGSIRIQTDGLSPTVSRQWGTGGNNVPFVGVRRLTPLECCRLQGFPDDWLDGMDLSDSAKYRMLGNAVAVPVAAWVAGRI